MYQFQFQNADGSDGSSWYAWGKPTRDKDRLIAKAKKDDAEFKGIFRHRVIEIKQIWPEEK